MIIFCNKKYEPIIMLVNQPLVQLYMWEEVLVCFSKLISVLFQSTISLLFLFMFGFHCSLLGSLYFWTDFQMQGIKSWNFFSSSCSIPRRMICNFIICNFLVLKLKLINNGNFGFSFELWATTLIEVLI